MCKVAAAAGISDGGTDRRDSRFIRRRARDGARFSDRRYTLTVYRVTVAVTVCSCRAPSLCTATVCRHCMRSLYAGNVCSHYAPSLCTVTVCRHCIQTLCAVTAHMHGSQTRRTDTVCSHSRTQSQCAAAVHAHCAQSLHTAIARSCRPARCGRHARCAGARGSHTRG